MGWVGGGGGGGRGGGGGGGGGREGGGGGGGLVKLIRMLDVEQHTHTHTHTSPPPPLPPLHTNKLNTATHKPCSDTHLSAYFTEIREVVVAVKCLKHAKESD